MPKKQKHVKKMREVHVLLLGFALIGLVMLVTFVRPDSALKQENAPSQDADSAAYSNTLNSLSFIQKEELHNKLSRKTSLGVFDLRDASLFSESHISGSINTSVNSIKSTYENMQPKPAQIVLVDTSAETTAIVQSVQALKSAGIQNIVVLAGGYGVWNPFEYQTVSNGDPNSFTDVAKVRPITPKEARKLRGRTDIVFLDTRSRQAYEAIHLEPSVNIPLDELESRYREISPISEIIVYGANELESFRSGVRLFDLGLLRAQTLSGGFDDLKDRTSPEEDTEANTEGT